MPGDAAALSLERVATIVASAWAASADIVGSEMKPWMASGRVTSRVGTPARVNASA